MKKTHDIIYAPFTDEQVQKLNELQQSGSFHPFTCMGAFCDRNKVTNQGLLVAVNEGWICPCGKYTQKDAIFILDLEEFK